MYAKIFSQIYDGTLCTNGPWQALVTFQQLLVLADQDGCVDMTAGAISRRTTIPIEIISLGILELEKPDPESRTPLEEGRRLVPLSEGRPWGWKIVNYKHYRELKREEDRRDYHREYWHKRKHKNSTPLNTTQPAQPNQPIAEAEEEEEKKTCASSEARLTKLPSKKAGIDRVTADLFAEFWRAYPKKRAKDEALKAFAKRKPDSELLAEMLTAIARQAESNEWRCNDGQFIPYPATWINGGRWLDDEQNPGADTRFRGAI